MNDLQKRILEIMQKPHMASLATVTEDGKPWVRYVMSVASDDLTIRFSSFLKARKVAHIRKNPEVHLTCGVTDPMSWKSYLQIQGRAEISTDPAEKKDFWNDHLKEIFEGPDDPNYAVVIVRPYRMELNTIGSFKAEVLEV